MSSLPEVQRKRRNFLLRLLGTAIAFGVVAFLVWQNWSDFMASLKALPLPFLLAALGLAFISRIMVTLRWYFLLKVVEPEVSFWQVSKLSFAGLFTTNILPSTIGGDVVKLGGAVQAGFDPAKVTASLVMDRLTGMATMATFLPLGLWRVIQGGEGVLGGISFAPGTFITRAWEKIRIFLVRTWESLQSWFQQPRQLYLAAFISYVHMACTFLMVVLVLSGLNDPVTFWTAGGVWVLVYFITLIPISINGLGLQEASLSVFFSSFGDVSEANSLVLALLMRLLFVVASFPGAFFLPGVLSRVREGRFPDQDDQRSEQIGNG